MRSTITSKGQIIVPKNVRERLNLAPGDRATYDAIPDPRIVIAADASRQSSIASLTSDR